MGKLGYAAVNVGEREMLMGYGEFLKKAEGVPFPFVSTNIVRQDTKEPVFKPYVVLEVKRHDKPIRVGILGVVRFNPLFLKSGPDKSNLVIASPKDMLKRYLAEVRKRSDVVVLLAALHQDDARLLARDLPGLDFVLGAYGGFVTTEDSPEGKTRILYSGNQGKNVGETRLFFQAEKIAAVSYTHQLAENYPDDERMLQFMRDVAARVNEQKLTDNQKTEETRADGARRPFAGTSSCRECHESEFAQWQGTGHAKAYDTLVGKSKERELACLVCHVTGAGEEGGFHDARSSSELVGVTCESCHGAGANHATKPAKGYGEVALSTCIPCHNRQNSPGFDYYTYLPRVLHGARSQR